MKKILLICFFPCSLLANDSIVTTRYVIHEEDSLRTIYVDSNEKAFVIIKDNKRKYLTENMSECIKFLRKEEKNE